jgi:hypothetical protein
LSDPSTKEVRYVGKTINLERRVRQHIWEANDRTIRTRKANWIRSLCGISPHVVILEEVDAALWEQRERALISEYRKRYPGLTNFSDGGETSPVEGKGHTEESKAKMRASALRNGTRPPSRKGMKLTDEQKSKFSELRKKLGTRPPIMGGWNKGQRLNTCKNGHEYTEKNTKLYFRKDRGYSYQICKTCERDAHIRVRMKGRR